jgi:hypothetical protein
MFLMQKFRQYPTSGWTLYQSMKMGGTLGKYLKRLAIITLAFLSLPTNAFAQDSHDKTTGSALPIGVCPDGRYESGCSQSDMEKAITLAKDYFITLRSRCLYQSEARCWVISSGSFASMERGGPIIWQHMQLMPADGPTHEMIIIAEGVPGDDIKLITARQVWGYFNSPDMIENSDDGVVFHIGGNVGGKGNADILLARTKAKWIKIDMDRWFDQVNALLPPGFEIRKSVKIDFRELFASSPVWREGDGECCASGGTVKIDYIHRDGVLMVSRLTFDEAKPVGQTQYIDNPDIEAAAQQEQKETLPDADSVNDDAKAKIDAERANAAFRKYQNTKIHPVKVNRMSECAAYWNRWKYSVDSMNNATFVEGLDPALLSNNAEEQSSYWLEKAKTKNRLEQGDDESFDAIMAKSDEIGDEAYAQWVNGDLESGYKLLNKLGACYADISSDM